MHALLLSVLHLALLRLRPPAVRAVRCSALGIRRGAGHRHAKQGADRNFHFRFHLCFLLIIGVHSFSFWLPFLGTL